MLSKPSLPRGKRHEEDFVFDDRRGDSLGGRAGLRVSYGRAVLLLGSGGLGTAKTRAG